MSDPVQSTANVWASERRLHPRFPTLLFSCVQLEDDNGGVVRDVSEYGLSMQIVRSLANDQSTRIRFQLRPSGSWVETRAWLIWSDPTRTLAGVQFEGLSSEGRILLRHWISSIANPRGAATAGGLLEREAPAKPPPFDSETPPVISNLEPERRRQPNQSLGGLSNGIAAALDSLDTKAQKPARPQILERRPEAISLAAIDRRRGSLWFPAVISVSLLLALGFFGLSLHRRAQRMGSDTSQTAAANSQSSLSAPVQVSQDNSTRRQDPPISVVSESIPGVFLQVGAMKDEGNADTLVRSLQQKGFPAIVFKETGSRFYKVLVGPCTDAQSAFATKARLQEQGFQKIIARASSR